MCDNKSFYTNKHQNLFEEIKPKKLIKVNLFEKNQRVIKKVNLAGYYIHRNLHLSKYAPKVILHTHSKNAVAISCLEFFDKSNQSSLRFYKSVEYVDYNARINQVEEKNR